MRNHKEQGRFSGFERTGTRPVWKVWTGSTRGAVRFAGMTAREAARHYRRLEEFERQTRQPGRQNGALGRNGLAVARAFLFRFLNHRTGQLDPSYETIARAAAISPSSVHRGLRALRAAGVLDWVRRCTERLDEAGRYCLEQVSNAYGFRPLAQWLGYRTAPAAPPPEPGTWGDHPCGTREPLTEAVAAGVDMPLLTKARLLEGDPANPLAMALARLGRTLAGDRQDKALPGLSA